MEYLTHTKSKVALGRSVPLTAALLVQFAPTVGFSSIPVSALCGLVLCGCAFLVFGSSFRPFRAEAKEAVEAGR